MSPCFGIKEKVNSQYHWILKVMCQAPGYKKFVAFCTKAGMIEDEYPIICKEAINEYSVPRSNLWPKNNPKDEDFGKIDSDKHGESQKTTLSEEDKATAFLKLHYHFEHLSFNKLKEMAKQGGMDKKLYNTLSQSAQHVHMLS